MLRENLRAYENNEQSTATHSNPSTTMSCCTCALFLFLELNIHEEFKVKKNDFAYHST